MVTENNRELTITRLFKAPRERVFQAWTNPALVAQWWGPTGVTNPTCEVDARVGGTIYIVMLAGPELGELQGSEWPIAGTFQEVTSPEKLVYTSNAIIGGVSVMETLSTITFEEAEGGTKMIMHVQVTKVTPEAEGPLAGMKMGWTQSFDKLGVFLGQ